jgi:hypothetical protein
MIIMKNALPIRFILFVAVVCLFTGCAATRPIADAALGAGGAYVGHELSNGDPIATAAGAAGGVIVSEARHYGAPKQAEKAYPTGYDKGKSDAVKQQSWLYVSMQRQSNQLSSVGYTPFSCPNSALTGSYSNLPSYTSVSRNNDRH